MSTMAHMIGHLRCLAQLVFRNSAPQHGLCTPSLLPSAEHTKKSGPEYCISSSFSSCRPEELTIFSCVSPDAPGEHESGSRAKLKWRLSTPTVRDCTRPQRLRVSASGGNHRAISSFGHGSFASARQYRQSGLRLARSIGDLQDIVRTIKARGASLRATEQPIDTSTAAGKCFLRHARRIRRFRNEPTSRAPARRHR
jgi:Resolvase, N terminal domain